LTMWAAAAALASVCAYYIGKELIPTWVYYNLRDLIRNTETHTYLII
jgi:hypothetical protein